MGAVTDPAAWNAASNPADFTIRFDVDGTTNPATTTYDLVDNVSGNSLLTGAAASATGPYLRTFTPGSAINLRSQGAEPAFDHGATVTIDGSPGDTDTFTLRQSPTQSMFTTVNDVINALSTTIGSAAQSAKLTNDLGAALANIDQAINRALDVQTAIGARMKEIDETEATNSDLVVQFDASVSELRDVDYAQAISDLTLQKTLLEAAQKSFIQTQNLSLFNLL
jgi:flagellar hook-associated protein 3 FlgL